MSDEEKKLTKYLFSHFFEVLPKVCHVVSLIGSRYLIVLYLDEIL